MARIAEQDTAPETIEATVNYLLETGDTPFTFTGGAGWTEVRSGGTQDPRRVVIRNGRRYIDRFALERDGFHFVRHDTKVADFFDADEVRARLLPGDGSADQGARAAPGASSCSITRCAPPTTRSARNTRSASRCAAPITTTPNGRGRSACATCCRTRPRALAPPLRDHPGVAADPPSGRDLPARDLRCDESSPKAICWSRSGAIRTGSARPMPSRYNPEHRWYWFPRMRRDEALVFKVYDSLTDGRARWTAHTAFDDPTAPPDARPRESIEIRTLAFF